MVYYGREKRMYSLGECISSGGEGTVYHIQDAPQLVAKLYSPKRLAPRDADSDPRNTLCSKLCTMLRQPIEPYVGKVLTIAWPQDLLFDAEGKFVGYVMPKIADGYPLCAACRETERVQLFRKYSFKTAVTVAYNLALAVRWVHDSGAVVGDLNIGNILVNSRGHIALVDVDSYGITDRVTGEQYPCEVAVDEVLAPELLLKNRRKFSVQSDRFTLAVHLFCLLMNNSHPFAVPNLAASQASASPMVDNICAGYCPYIHGKGGNPDAPNINMLPPDIRALFCRAFDYTAATATDPATIARRPSAREWQSALYALLNNLQTCHKGHVYPAGYPRCPWCELEQQQPEPVPSEWLNAARRHQAKPAVYRDASLLWAGCVGAGALLAPQLQELFCSLVNPSLGPDAARYLLAAAGIVAGCLTAYNAQDVYRSSTGWLGWGLLCLLVPLFGAVLAAVGLLAWALLMMLVNAVLCALMVLGILYLFAQILGS